MNATAARPRTTDRAILIRLGVEWLFVLAPLVLLAVMGPGHGTPPASPWQSTEWHFGSVVLLGQGLVRFVHASSRIENLSAEKVGLAVAAVVVFLLGPAVVLLVRAHDGHGSSSVLPALLFGVATGAYLVLAGIGEVGAERSRREATDGSQASPVG